MSIVIVCTFTIFSAKLPIVIVVIVHGCGDKPKTDYLSVSLFHLAIRLEYTADVVHPVVIPGRETRDISQIVMASKLAVPTRYPG